MDKRKQEICFLRAFFVRFVVVFSTTKGTKIYTKGTLNYKIKDNQGFINN